MPKPYSAFPIDPENDIFSETGLSKVQGVDNTYEDEVSSLDEIDDVFFPAMSTSRANEIGESNSHNCYFINLISFHRFNI